MSYAKIIDHPTLFRDMHNQHILQTDTSVLRKHEVRMKAIEEKKAMKAEIDTIKSDIQDIKRLLQALVPNQFGGAYAQPYLGGAAGHISGPYVGPAFPLTVGAVPGGFVPLSVGQTFTCNTNTWVGSGADISPMFGVAGTTGNTGGIGIAGGAGISTAWNVK